MRGRAVEHHRPFYILLDDLLPFGESFALPVSIIFRCQNVGWYRQLFARLVNEIRQALIETAKGKIRPKGTVAEKAGFHIVLVEIFARLLRLAAMPVGHLAIEPAQPIVVGQGDPSIIPVNKAVQPIKNALPLCIVEMIGRAGHPAQCQGRLCGGAEFREGRIEVVKAVTRAKNHDLSESRCEVSKILDNLRDFLVEIGFGVFIPDGITAGKLRRVEPFDIDIEVKKTACRR